MANTAFLQGGSDGPNAVAARVSLLHVLDPDHSKIGTAEPAAVQPDRPAQLQRRQLAARQRCDAPPGTHAVTSDGLLALPEKPESGAVAMMQPPWRCPAHSPAHPLPAPIMRYRGQTSMKEGDSSRLSRGATVLDGREEQMHARGRIVFGEGGTVSPVSLIELFGPSCRVTNERHVCRRIDSLVT